MPTIIVNTADTFEDWRVKSNELGARVADLDNNLFTINVIASGNITASGNINALGNLLVTNYIKGSTNTLLILGNTSITQNTTVTGNIVGLSNLVISGNVIAGNILSNVNYGTYVTSKPAINVLFTGNIVGSGNILLSNSGTNILNITNGNVGLDSVTLGLHTVGNYTTRVIPGTSITVTGTADEGNIITVNHADTSSLSGLLGSTGLANITVDGLGHITAVNVANYLTDTVTTTAASYGNANVVSQITLDTKGRITSASNVTIDRDYALTTKKPSINLRFLGDTSGAGNIAISSSDKNELAISLTVSSISGASFPTTTVTPGTYGGANVFSAFTVDATGRLTAASNVTISDTGVSAGSYGNANAVSQVTVDSKGRVTAAANLIIDRSYSLTTKKPSINLNFTGDVTGKANLNLSAENTNNLDVALTIAADSIVLGTDTTGNYTNRVVPGTMMTVTGTADEGNVITINHSDTSTLNGAQGSSGIASITVDDRGHVTAVTTATYLTSVPTITLGSGTDGNYTNRVVPGTGISVSGTADEGNVITVGLTNTGVAATTYGNATIVPVITVDAQGRITSASNVNISGVGGAGTTYTISAETGAGGSNANIRLTGSDASTDNVSLIAGGNITITRTDVNNITISATGGAGSNVFSYFGGVNGNTISQTNSTHTAINTVQFNFFAGRCAGNAITTGCHNIFMGLYSGCSITSGRHNNFFGYGTGLTNTFGNSNNFFGNCAGYSNLSGQYNNFFGQCAGFSNTTGGNNNFFGNCAGHCNTTGNDNTFIGRFAGRFNTTGGNNNFFGLCAGYGNTTGCFNNFFGICPGYCNTTGSNNNFFGQCAGFRNSTGGNNNFFGQRAGFCNTTGNYNFFFGRYAGRSNNIGSENTFFGLCAGFCNTGGCRNIAIGTSSGANVETGNDNIIIGCLTSCAGFTGSTSNVIVLATSGIQRFEIDSNLNNIIMGTCAGNATTTGCYNFFAGFCAGANNNSGCRNNFLGDTSGYCNSCGCYNNFLGANAGFSNNGNYNNFFGYSTGSSNTTGEHNNFFGALAGFVNSTGCHNNFFGYKAGCGNTVGIDNFFVGHCAGRCNTSGSRNIAIGGLSGANVTTGNDNIIIGCVTSSAGFTQSTSNVIVLATGGIERIKGIGNKMGINNNNPTATLTIGGAAHTPPVDVTFNATTMTLDCLLSNVFTTTFTNSVTVAPSVNNPQDGQTINWFITQDNVGGRTMTWPTSFKWPSGASTLLSTGANAVDLVTATYRSATGFWYASLLKGFA